MLTKILKDAFVKNHGEIHYHTLRTSNEVTYKMTDDGRGFIVEKKCRIVFPFEGMDNVEEALKLVAMSNGGKIYYGDHEFHSGARLGGVGGYNDTINAIVARRCLGKQDGESSSRFSTYIAALLECVGFATMHSTDGKGRYITLGR